jgi:hypothetical protein
MKNAEVKISLFKTFCGGTINNEYMSIPFIKLLILNNEITIRRSRRQDINIKYSEIEDVKITGDNYFIRLHRYIFPLIFWGSFTSILTTYIRISFGMNLIIPDELYYIITFILVYFIGEINIYNGLEIKIKNKKNTLIIYPVKLNESYDLIKNKIKDLKQEDFYDKSEAQP